MILETEPGQRLESRTSVGEHPAWFEIDGPDGANRYLEISHAPRDPVTCAVSSNIPGCLTRGIRTRRQALTYFASVVGAEISRALGMAA